MLEVSGIQVGAADPEILRAVAAGITAAELRAAAQGKPGKPVAWYTQRAIGRRADAAAKGQPPPAPAPADPAIAAAEAEYRRLDDEITDVAHRARFGMGIEPEEARARIDELRAQQSALRQEAST